MRRGIIPGDRATTITKLWEMAAAGRRRRNGARRPRRSILRLILGGARLTGPQVVYLCAVGVYLVFFLLFARFFLWKYLAERDYWRVRPPLTVGGLTQAARAMGRRLPRFTILVPARNEAQVIAKTVEHLVHLDYPRTSYEVLVATDEKELEESSRLRAVAVDEAQRVLTGRVRAAGRTIGPTSPVRVSADAGKVLVQILSDQALIEYTHRRGQYTMLTTPAGLAWIPPSKQVEVLRGVAAELIEGNGRISMRRLFCLLERTVPGRPAGCIGRDYPSLLGLAMPVVAAYCELGGNGHRRLVSTMLQKVAHAQHRTTKEILGSLARLFSSRILDSLACEDRDVLRARLEAAAELALPTTQDVLERKVEELARCPAAARVRHVVVPFDFDGVVGGRCTGRPVPSTKGRALNYALAFVDEDTEICGFYDAESRPDPRVLMYVAWRRLCDSGARLFQGPVFQVRNFFQMSPLCKIASLYQAIAHEWYLPQLFRRLPFVGGTNLFVERALLTELGGYDQGSLTEDLELGVRAYLRTGVWPEYLPYVSSEQTPPTLKGFFRQRLRWGTGHLQVMDKLRSDATCDQVRRGRLLHHLFIKGQLEWSIYQLATLIPPTVLILYALGYVDPNVLPPAAHAMLNGFTAVYFAFTAYAYVRYLGYLDMSGRPRNPLGHWSVLPQLILLPLAAFMFPVPYSTAMVLKGLGREPKAWVKTPRTAE